MVGARRGVLVVGAVSFLGGELQSVCLEFLSGTGKVIRGGFERAEG